MDVTFFTLQLYWYTFLWVEKVIFLTLLLRFYYMTIVVRIYLGLSNWLKRLGFGLSLGYNTYYNITVIKFYSLAFLSRIQPRDFRSLFLNINAGLILIDKSGSNLHPKN